METWLLKLEHKIRKIIAKGTCVIITQRLWGLAGGAGGSGRSPQNVEIFVEVPRMFGAFYTQLHPTCILILWGLEEKSSEC